MVPRLRDPGEAAQREAGIQTFRAYYKLMGVLPDDDFEPFMRSLFQPLPVSFRVSAQPSNPTFANSPLRSFRL